MKNNFFAVNRGLLNSPRWLSEKFTRGQAWIDLFGIAQHSDSFIRVRGIKVEIKRGQLGYSKLTLSKRWKWSVGKVSRYLKELEKDGDIEQQNNRVTTLITILRYNQWQLNGKQTDEQTENKQTTYKNDKNEKNNIADIKSAEEIFNQKEYIQKMRNNKAKHIKLIGWYFESRKAFFPNIETIRAETKRWLKDASFVSKYPPEKIGKAHLFVKNKFPDEWNLSTIKKYIAEI